MIISTSKFGIGIWKKVIASLFLLLLCTSLIAVRPNKAHAQVACLGLGAAGVAAAGAVGVAAPSGLPVQDRANLIMSTKIAADTTVQSTVTCILNGLAWTVAKMTVQSLTRSTVNWINSGFKGSPAFVSDLKKNLSSLADAVADDFFNHLNQEVINTTGFNIKSPFQDQISQKLRQEYYRTTSSWGLDYTLSQSSKDPQAFLNGNFNQGGFNAFLSASQNPANNPFGAYQLASNQLWSQIDAAAQQRKSELDWGRGFLPWRGSCNTAAKTVSNTASHENAGHGAPAESLSTSEKCPFNSVRTPGSVIESQLENSLGSGIRQLELADSVNEIVGALMGQLVNQVLGSGGLLGASQPSSGGGQSYLTQATNPSQYDSLNSSLASGVLQNIENDKTGIIDYQSNWQKILDSANNAQQTCGVSSDITTTISSATSAVARASKALVKIGSIKLTIQNAAASTAVDKSSQITSALADYQSYLSSTEIPNLTDITESALQSNEFATTTPGLYLQMKNLSTSCRSS